MWIYSRKFDEDKNRVTLNSDYIFSFLHRDGFNERLLLAELLIDDNFDYWLQMQGFQHEKITKNKSDFFLEKGDLPERILDYIERLIDSDIKSLKNHYDFITFVTSDCGAQHFLINLDYTIDIDIIDGLPLEYFKTDAELLLFEFNEYMKAWIEEKYEAWLISD